MLKFTVSRTFTTYTPESIDMGDSDDNGFMFEDEEMDFRDVMRELDDMSWLSSSPPHPDDNHMWAEQESWTSCYRTGETRSEAVHISHVNGKEITGHQLRRLFKAAGLIKPRDFTESEKRAHLMRCHRKEAPNHRPA